MANKHEAREPSTKPVVWARSEPGTKPVVWARSEPGTTRFYVGLGQPGTNKWPGSDRKLDTVD
jgi:hypothetical protein